MNLTILCAGAAKGLVGALQQTFTNQTGVEVQGSFGTVGAIHEKLLAGDPCDVIVLTQALLQKLAQSGEIVADSVVPLGTVQTGIAVRTGAPLPDIADRAALAESLLAAKGIYIPDATRSTAGIHFAGILKQLGILETVESRLISFPNGAAAMTALAQSEDSPLMGCTQLTEINYTPGVSVVGTLPAEFGLATVYSIAVCSSSSQPGLAQQLVALLAGPASAQVRRDGGFEV